MQMKLTGKTKVLGIIGWPVTHSLSPLMQNAVLQETGLDYVYVPFAVSPDCLAEAVEGLRRLNVAGFNVTIPHKTAILPLLDDVSAEVRMIGAANTVVREGERLIGHNTDCSGFIASLKRDLGFEPLGREVLVIGAGGAARAAVAGLCGEGAASIVIANRSEARTESLIHDIRHFHPSIGLVAAPLEVLSAGDVLRKFDLIVNTTSVGMNGTSFERIDLSLLKKDACIYDMVYVPAETPLLAAAASCGIRGANGLGMLAAQGEAAFRIWTGVNPPAGRMAEQLSALLSGQD